jgi:hypothetical protein
MNAGFEQNPCPHSQHTKKVLSGMYLSARRRLTVRAWQMGQSFNIEAVSGF